MGPATWSGAVDPPGAPAVRDGVVFRPGLVALLGAAGRVTEVSAPAGSGKTLLLRTPYKVHIVRLALAPDERAEVEVLMERALAARPRLPDVGLAA